MFSPKEKITLDYARKVLVPNVHKLMSESNPLLYVRYGGRCCRQISVVLAMFLNKALPNYEWEAWENILTDGLEDYDHSWNFGRSKICPTENIILDFGKLEHEYFFLRKQRSNEYYPEHIRVQDEEYLFDEEVDESDRKKVNVGTKETFTGESFDWILSTLEERLQITYPLKMEDMLAKLV